MYREIIELKKDISNETLSKIKDICISAHYNRAGKVDIMELSEHCFVFQGEEVDYGCLILGYLELDDIKIFKDNVISWMWEDEDPDESCDLLDISLRYSV